MKYNLLFELMENQFVFELVEKVTQLFLCSLPNLQYIHELNDSMDFYKIKSRKIKFIYSEKATKIWNEQPSI